MIKNIPMFCAAASLTWFQSRKTNAKMATIHHWLLKIMALISLAYAGGVLLVGCSKEKQPVEKKSMI
jgi:hypothetical protein